MDYFLIWVFPALLAAGMGIFLWLTANVHIRRCERIAAWSKTDGKVESAEVVQRSTRRYRQSLRSSYRTVRYEPEIFYSFSVNGQPYRSRSYRNFNGEYFPASQAWAAEIVAKYPPGSVVNVTYNPANPCESYLQPSTNPEKLLKQRVIYLLVILVGILWLIIGTSINLAGQTAANKAENEIRQGEALIPVSADRLETELESFVKRYELNCDEDSMAGNLIIYQHETCSKGEVTRLTSIEIFVRTDDPQKIDLVSAIQTPLDVQESIAYFSDVAALCLKEEQKKAAASWIQDSLQTVIDSGSSNKITLDGTTLTLDNLGTNIRLNIGQIQ